VGISGVSYTPPIPVREKAEEKLAAILGADASATEKALDLFLWGTRAQLFWDGNKRTSLLAANKILVSAGKGMLTITEKDMPDFNALLAAWYETGEGETLKGFLWERAISGMVV
jgi:prophage maintenance system killer protein